ncbi:ELMO domain [Arabidopsis suecica]|uniref:ELMO domain n=1 Tax=Arabidopsis suecica TaxID=45249 RepID=A0A8T2A3S4_ARASU|nr:ELMO domain [Arabidopsis suecica]
MQASIAPGRVELQCYYWDCERARTPHCTPTHRDQALHGEGDNSATIVVDGLQDDKITFIAKKCLRLKLLQHPCGVPILPVAVLKINPWLQNNIFSRDLEPLERKRGWVFSSVVGPENPVGNNIGNVWRFYDTKPAGPTAPGITIRRWYLQREATSADGIFKLSRYSTNGLQVAVYWLHFQPTVPGVPGVYIPRPRVEIEPPRSREKKNSGSEAGPAGKKRILGGNSEQKQLGGAVGVLSQEVLRCKANIQTAVNDLRVESFQDPLRKQDGAEQSAFGPVVLHMDRNDYYGGESTSLNLNQGALKDPWKLSFLEEKINRIASMQWKEMGWQGKDQMTEFRRGGFTSLENLLYFARNSLVLHMDRNDYYGGESTSLNLNQEALKDPWKLSFLEEKINRIVSMQWKEMGWQGKDQMTEFSCGGFTSLENLLYFARNLLKSFQDLQWKQADDCSVLEYLKFVARINITVMVIQMLESYSRRASYMEFNTVMKSTRREIMIEDITEEKEEALYLLTRLEDLPSFNLRTQ